MDDGLPLWTLATDCPQERATLRRHAVDVLARAGLTEPAGDPAEVDHLAEVMRRAARQYDRTDYVHVCLLAVCAVAERWDAFERIPQPPSGESADG